MSLLSNTTSNVEIEPKYSSIDLAKDLEEYVEENYNLYKRQKYPEASLTLGKYFDKFVGKFVHLVTGEPIMSKNIKKKQLMKAIRAIGKQQIEKRAAPTVSTALVQFKKKTPQEIKESIALQNKLKTILQTMPSSVKKLVPKTPTPSKKLVKGNKKGGLLRNSEVILAKLTKHQKKGLLTNVSSTRNSRGKIVGINYDYSSSRNRNFIKVSLTNDMMVVNTRQLVTQIETESALVGKHLYTVMINPTQSLGGEREKRFASCFDKYDIMNCCFEYNPASATTVSGNMFGGFDFDPTQYYPESQDGLEKLLTKPGSHDCMFYGGGKAGQYLWEMPRYPGKKPTFFIDQTDTSGSGIRFANEAQFLLVNGFGIKTAELGIMGSLWCEMTTKFYDPYIQNIDGTESLFYWDPTVGNIVSWVYQDDQNLTLTMNTPAPHNSGGVEFVQSISGLGEAGYYVPPGVWTIDVMFNGVMQTPAESLIAGMAPALGLAWWNATQTDWVKMNGDTGGLPVSTPAYHTGYSRQYNKTGDAMILTWPAYCTFAFGRIVVPNDGFDYYLTFTNQSGYYLTDGSFSGVFVTIAVDHTAPSPSTVAFRWHTPNDYEVGFLGTTSNVVLVDRVKSLESKIANLERLEGMVPLKLIREEKHGKARKMESTIKVAAVLPDLYDDEDDEEEKPHTPLKQEQKFVRVDPPPVAQTVVSKDGTECFLYKEGDGLRKCDPPPGAWVYYSEKRVGAYGPTVWKRVINDGSVGWSCMYLRTKIPQEFVDSINSEAFAYECEKNQNLGWVQRSLLDMTNNEPLVRRSKSVSLK